jgi:hypothetical protein
MKNSLSNSGFSGGEQLCKLAAAAPEHGPERGHSMGVSKSVPLPRAFLLHAVRWVIPGSRLLPSDRTATLRSGSPPGIGRATTSSLGGRARSSLRFQYFEFGAFI